MSARSIREARARRKRRIRGHINGHARAPARLGVPLQQGDLRPGRRRRRRGDPGRRPLGRDRRLKGLKKAEVAKKVGELLAQRAKDKGVERVVFDRSGYLYHGRVKALAEGAREGGLVF